MKIALKLGLFLFVVSLAFSMGFVWRDVRLGVSPSKQAFQRLLAGKIDDGVTPTQLFRDNYNVILSQFHRPIDQTNLRTSGMEGLFASLGDPHTVFMERQEAENFSIETRGNYAGIGARLGPDPLGARVSTVFENGPAFKAGLKPGDIVTRVDKTDIAGMSIDETVNFVRGEENSKVTLRVLREGESQPLRITITRAVVIVPTAEGTMIEGTNVGYITVSQFAETTVAQFDEALGEVLRNDPDGIVIDMRGNPGGLLETAVAMLSNFVDGKPVVSMLQKGGRREQSATYRGRTIGYTGPIVVLIDESSASASEIFAGVMRDYKKATLVGVHSYGKASVQTVILLKDLNQAKVTVARYYLPSGENISRVVDEDGMYVSGGIKPHFVVELDRNVVWEPGKPEKDAQLAAAINLIKQKRGN